MQEYYIAFKASKNAFCKYQEECTQREEAYGEKAAQKAETMHEKIQRYQQKANRHNTELTYHKGAR